MGRSVRKYPRGIPSSKSGVRAARVVVIFVDGRYLKIQVPAADRGKRWNASTLKAHIEYYLKRYLEKAKVVPRIDYSLAYDADSHNPEMKAVLRLLVEEVALLRKDVRRVVEYIHNTRTELGLAETPFPLKDLTLAAAKKKMLAELLRGSVAANTEGR